MAAGWLLYAAAVLGDNPTVEAAPPHVPHPIPYSATEERPLAVTAGAAPVAAAAHQEPVYVPPGANRPPERTQLRAINEEADPAPQPPAETTPPPQAPVPIAEQPFTVPQQYTSPPPMQSLTDEREFGAPPPAAIMAGRSPSLGTETGDENADDKSAQPKDRSWFALAVASFVLFLSLGSNLYLGWLTWSFRDRCRRLASDLRRLRFGGGNAEDI